MGASTGSYSRGIKGPFDEEKRYLLGLVQKKIPWIDADENDKEWMRFTFIRRALQAMLDNSSPNDGFLCVGDGAVNDFQISGDPGHVLGGGRIWVGGLPCLLVPDVRYVNAGANEGERSVHPQVTLVGTTFIEDSAASYAVNELAGRTITPDIVTPATTFTVVSNTATRLTLSGNPQTAGVVAGSRYRIELSTPPAGPARLDAVYLNVYLDEVGAAEDPDLYHEIGSLIEAQRRLQVVQTIFVREDVALHGELTNYTDADGNEHFVSKVATLLRPGAQAAINSGDVTDFRATSGDLAAFVRKIGDTMTGNLVMANGADIALGAGSLVDGRDPSVDGAKLDSLDFTGAGVSALLTRQAKPVRGTDLAGVTGSSKNASHDFRTRVAGGGEGQAGAVTDPPFNLAKVREKDHSDDILTASGARVFGRLTGPNQLALTGTLHFTNAALTVTGTGTLFTTEVQVGDIIRLDSEGTFLTVAGIVNDGELTTVQGFPGVTASGAGTRRRFVLSFFSNEEGTETAHTFGAPTDLTWAFLESFPVYQLPTFPEDWVFPSDQLAGDIPNASTTQTGKVLLAALNEAAAGKAVQANDPRLLPPAIGGQTNTVVGVKGLENSGTNIDAIVRPLSGLGVIGYIGPPGLSGATVTILPGGGDPVSSDLSLLGGSVSVSARVDRIALVIYAQCEIEHDLPAGSGLNLRLQAEVRSGGSTIDSSSVGFSPRTFGGVGFENDFNGGTRSVLAVQTTGVTGALVVSWGNFTRNGPQVEVRNLKRVIHVFEVVGTSP